MVLTEFGVPFDMEKLNVSKDFKLQNAALNANMHAVETTLMNSCIWNYCPNNTSKWGDGWNGEDLSVFSNIRLSLKDLNDIIDETNKSSKENDLEIFTKNRKVDPNTDINNHLNKGGRALNGLVRPYACKTIGIPTSLYFNQKEGCLVYSFKCQKKLIDSSNKLCTEIFLPNQQYPMYKEVDVFVYHLNGKSKDRIDINDCEFKIDREEQLLKWNCSCLNSVNDIEVEHVLFIRSKDNENGSLEKYAEKKMKKSGWCVFL